MPGIVIGLLCLLSMPDRVTDDLFDSSPLWQFAVVSVVLNYINLLPFGMLDGGRIVQLLFLRRFPRIQYVFLVASAAVFLGVAVLTNDPILWMLGLFSALGLSPQWKIAKLRSQWAHDFEAFEPPFVDADLDAESNERREKLAVFAKLAQPPWVKSLPIVKDRLAQQLLSYVTAPKTSLTAINRMRRVGEVSAGPLDRLRRVCEEVRMAGGRGSR